ncbi:pyruvate kinase [Verrucomicrobiaceae bacterium N1E253]|uniref:Pyruvate kinase n=1 Tax=Oceaniferula marina TaxID=2748318 RepID=A0A851GHJ1_9BACT|nr:pyruvate kinase [Oceaniferula marina]NWK54705.1 pyruvate kinase [Oceaniferula marina]
MKRTNRKTRIICTLGPATDSDAMLESLIAAGANVFRLNMSHAKHDWVRDVCARIRRISAEMEEHVAILCDLQGPSIRTGDVDGELVLTKGDLVEFRKADAAPSMELSTTVNYVGLMADVSVGDRLIVDNGNLLMLIKEVNVDRIICEVKTDGTMGSRRHINLPGVRLNLPALTRKDHLDLAVACDCAVDYIAGSFVRDAAHVRELHAAMLEGGGDAQIIAKIEDQEAVRNIDDIIAAADVIMVARGDLGIEVNIEELPILQRKIVQRCLKLGTRVIVATHMLESMISNPLPTRAEVTDVSNAVFEEADSVMLSGETSVGKYPIECVEILDRIARRIERSGGMGYGKDAVLRTERQKTVRSAIQLVDSIPEAQLVVFTRRGYMPVQASLFRPTSNIHAFAANASTCRKVVLARGVTARQIDFGDDLDSLLRKAVAMLKDEGVVRDGTPLVVISDMGQKGEIVDSVLLIHA